MKEGQVVAGDFRLEARLSEGGMGEVFTATQLSTGKPRAIKVMKRDLARDPRFVERFELEAKAGSHVASEHVVEVVAAGIDADSGSPWLAMELLDGHDLAALVDERGKLPATEVVLLFGQLAHALEAAHAAGIVHRDLKPQNLFVAKSRLDGVPFMLKVLDFGIAKLVVQATGNERTESLGTPMWMAPEQVESDGVTASADIWPLGLIAYYALTGRMYWKAGTGASITALLKEVLLDPIERPSVRLADQALDPALLPATFDAWFLRCVDRDPKARFSSVREATNLLARVFGGTPTIPPETEDIATANTMLLGSLPPATAKSREASTTTPPPLEVATTGEVSTLPSPEGILTPKDRIAEIAVGPPLQAAPNAKRAPWLAAAALGTFFVLSGAGYTYIRLHSPPRPLPKPTTTAVAKPVTELLGETFSSIKTDESPIPIGDGDLVLGDEKALVAVVLFCGFTDDECVRLSKEADLARTKKDSHVTVVYAAAVPRGDKDARLAAEAAAGVYDSAGAEAFTKFRDQLFAHRGEVTRANVVGWARAAGVLDADTFAKRIDEGRWSSRVDKSGNVAAKLRLSRSTMLANCRVVRRADEIAAEGESVRSELLALDAKKDPVERSLGLQMYDPYAYHCEESSKAPTPFGIHPPLSTVARSPFSSDGSEDAAREAIVRYFADKKRGALLAIATESRAGSTLARVTFLGAAKSGDKPKVASIEAVLAKEGATWRVTGERSLGPTKETCASAALTLGLTAPRVSATLLASPSPTERSAGCLTRVALVEGCRRQSCTFSVACDRGDATSVIHEVRVDPGSGKVSVGPDYDHLEEVETEPEARGTLPLACASDGGN